MIEIVATIKARLEALPWMVYDSDATGVTTYPYVLLLPPAGGLSDDFALSGPRGHIDDEVMVRAVSPNADAVRGVLNRCREALTNNGRPLHFNTASWRVTLVRQPGAVPILVDRDVTLTTSDRHPLFATDFYNLTATPL